MLGRGGIGAHQQHAPVRDMRQRGPYLLAVDDEVIAVKLGSRPQGREIRSGTRFGKSLAPDFFAGEDFAQMTPLLLLGSVREYGGAGQEQPDDVERMRRVRARLLFAKDCALHQARVLTAELAGPFQPEQTVVVQAALPAAQEIHVGVALGRDIAGRTPSLRQTGLQEVAYPLSERLFLRAVIQVQREKPIAGSRRKFALVIACVGRTGSECRPDPRRCKS